MCGVRRVFGGEGWEERLCGLFVIEIRPLLIFKCPQRQNLESVRFAPWRLASKLRRHAQGLAIRSLRSSKRREQRFRSADTRLENPPRPAAALSASFSQPEIPLAGTAGRELGPIRLPPSRPLGGARRRSSTQPRWCDQPAVESKERTRQLSQTRRSADAAQARARMQAFADTCRRAFGPCVCLWEEAQALLQSAVEGQYGNR